MAEKEAAERKAKAERAKKLLAQRRKEKGKASVVTSPSIGGPASPAMTGIDTPNVPSARTSLSLGDDMKPDLDEKPSTEGTTESQAAEEVDKLEDVSLQHTDRTPPPVVTPKKNSKMSEPSTPLGDASHRPSIVHTPSADSFANLQQTVSLLIAERTDLQGEISSLTVQLAAAKSDSQLLAEGRALIGRLEEENHSLEKKLQESEQETKKAGAIKGLLDKVREDLETAKREKSDLSTTNQELEKKWAEREAQENAQFSDLEKSLERAREREGGLEAEIRRLKQSYNETSSSLATVEKELEENRLTSSKAETSLNELRESHSALQTSHDSLTKEHESLSTRHIELSTAHETLSSDCATVSKSLEENKSLLENVTIESEKAKSALVQTTKRAEVAEKKRDALQEENGELVKQLEEVRGKVIQIMEEKLELAATVESWESKNKAWDKQRGELEEEVQQAKPLADQIPSLNNRIANLSEEVSRLTESNRELSEIATISKSLQTEHELLRTEKESIRAQLEKSLASAAQYESDAVALRAELDATLTGSSIHDQIISGLRKDLGAARAAAVADEETVAGIRGELKAAQVAAITHETTISSLRAELDALRSTVSESDSSISNLQKDLATSRAAVTGHELTIAALQAPLEARRTSGLGTTDLDPAQTSSSSTDVLGALQAQHDLEISDLTAQVRSLEASAHAATMKAHDFARQLTDVKAAYAHAQKERDDAIAAASESSASRSGGLFFASGDNYQASTYRSARSASVDDGLPASVRHKRQVSLNALKARMGPRPSVRPVGLDTLGEDDGQALMNASATGTNGHNRSSISSVSGVPFHPQQSQKQFGDEIMYCCPACEGEVITL